jgi:hypothetical protein
MKSWNVFPFARSMIIHPADLPLAVKSVRRLTIPTSLRSPYSDKSTAQCRSPVIARFLGFQVSEPQPRIAIRMAATASGSGLAGILTPNFCLLTPGSCLLTSGF